MSQCKIWKIVKERREQQDAERMRDDESREQLESAVGREIQVNNERDRAQWEAVYGDKDRSQVHIDSGVGSSIESFAKRSTSVREREVDDIEMADMRTVSSRQASKQAVRPTVTVRVASDEDTPPPTQSEEHLLDKADMSRSTSHRSLPLTSARTSSDGHDASSVRDLTQRSSVAAAPAVVPLPFTVPGQEGEEDDDDDGASDHQSVASKVTGGQSMNERRGVPLRHLSLKEADDDDRMFVPHMEDDRESSVAATADEDTNFDALSAPRLSAAPSPYQLDFDRDGLLAPSDDERDRSRSPGRSMTELPLEEDDEEAIVRPETATEEARSQPVRSLSKQQKRKSTASRRRSIASRRSERNEASEDEGENVSAVGSLAQHLPQKMSKVAMTYRTNEWAKHIAEADQPEVGEVPGSTSPGIQIDRAFAEEAAAPVDMEALKPGRVQKPSRNAPPISNKNPYRQSMQATPNTASRSSSSGAPTPVYASRAGSVMSIGRQNSNATLNGQPRLATQGLRNASAPLMSQPLVESPVEETLAASGPYRNITSPLELASTNKLMDERNNRVKRQPTSTSFNALSSALNFNVIAPSDSASGVNVRLDEPDSDNISLSERKQLLHEEMTLAERKAMMQQQRETMQHPTTRERQGTWPTPARNPNIIYDSHQPKRTNTVDTIKQSTMLSQWRQSLQQDAAARQPLLVDENARQAMILERRHAEWEQQRQYAERVSRQSVMDMAARSGQLHGVHRDAMRRMQAQASSRAPQ